MNDEVHEWNHFLLKHGPRSGRFLQSWQWGDFQKALGEQILRRRVDQNGEVMAQGLWIKKQLPGFGEYWYAPRGPISQEPLTQEIIRRLAPEQQPLFFRLEPVHPCSFSIKKSLDVQPAHTNILDLSKTEDELLADMHQKTRYNLRLAARKGVHLTLTKITLDDVWHLFEATGNRGGFRLHPRTYYETQLQALREGPCQAFLAAAFYERRAIATTIMIDFEDTRTYVHGASDWNHRHLMAPTLLHWELIRGAKSTGLRWYDWWGVAPQGAINHSWEGISRFKRGFGGEDIRYPGTYDLVLHPVRYHFYQLARRIRRSV